MGEGDMDEELASRLGGVLLAERHPGIGLELRQARHP
jgi:hypothetical protein